MLTPPPAPVRHPRCALPLPQLVLEARVHTEPVQLAQRPDGTVAPPTWRGPEVKAPFLAAHVTLLGEEGAMEALPFCLHASLVPAGGGAPAAEYLCPPPPALLQPELAAEAAARCELAANTLGLRGLATLEVLVSAESGEVLVLSASASPQLHAGSPVFQAALQHGERGLHPHELLRHVLNLARRAAAAGAGGGTLTAAGMGSDEEDDAFAADDDFFEDGGEDSALGGAVDELEGLPTASAYAEDDD